MSSDRFVVTELEGFLTCGNGKRASHHMPGISVQVIDRSFCHHVVASWRSEDYPKAGGKSGRQQVRQRAADYCARLNGEPAPQRPQGGTSSRAPLSLCKCGGPKSAVAVMCKPCRDEARRAVHGTISRYQNNQCRCPLCRAAWSQYMAGYRWRNGR